MTFTSEVGVSYVVHMNDDASEANSFSYVYYQALSSPCFEGRAWNKAKMPCESTLYLEVYHEGSQQASLLNTDWKNCFLF